MISEASKMPLVIVPSTGNMVMSAGEADFQQRAVKADNDFWEAFRRIAALNESLAELESSMKTLKEQRDGAENKLRAIMEMTINIQLPNQ